MMSWRFQMTKQVFDAFGEDVTEYAIREVYESEDGGLSWTANPVKVSGDSPEEVELALNRMLADISRFDVLDITALEEKNKTHE